MCSSRRSKCCKCHIGPIKKALHGYTYGGKDLLGSKAIYRERFELLLKKNEKRNISTDVNTKETINYMRQIKDMWQREHVRRRKKEEKKRDVPQIRAHQVE